MECTQLSLLWVGYADFGPYKNEKKLLVFHHPEIVKIKSELLEGEYTKRRVVRFKIKQQPQNKKRII